MTGWQLGCMELVAKNNIYRADLWGCGHVAPMHNTAVYLLHVSSCRGKVSAVLLQDGQWNSNLAKQKIMGDSEVVQHSKDKQTRTLVQTARVVAIKGAHVNFFPQLFQLSTSLLMYCSSYFAKMI